MTFRSNWELVTSFHNLEYVTLNLPCREVSCFVYAAGIHFNAYYQDKVRISRSRVNNHDEYCLLKCDTVKCDRQERR